VLEVTFGREALQPMHRLTAEGPVHVDLATELRQMQALFSGASAEVSRQLGMPAEAAPDPGSARDAEVDSITFLQWRAKLAEDLDLARDARMMVPIFFDRGRQKTKVWVFLGWAERRVLIGYAKPPQFEVFRDGKRLGKDAPEVRFMPESRALNYPVSAEVYVTELLDRAQFRKHCDRYKTRSAILENLR
jgi:hypothetical protein